MKQLIKEYFSFTRKERIAIIGLVVLVVVAYVLPYFISPPGEPPSAAEVREFQALEQQLRKSRRMDQLVQNKNSDDEQKQSIAQKLQPEAENNSPPARLFYFDPNTVSGEGWKQLGLRAKTVSTILNYLSRGGRFYEADDLKKIYGLRPQEYGRLAPYIRISKPSKELVARGNARNEQHFANSGDGYNSSSRAQNRDNQYARAIKTSIDINTADTTEWISLPGIGSKLAARIVIFRERLGGFYDVQQISETYGLADSTFQKILPFIVKGNEPVKKINLNTATLEALKQHPYIRWNIATAIIRFREQHGPFSTLESLQKIVLITPTIYAKLTPYLTLNPE